MKPPRSPRNQEELEEMLLEALKEPAAPMTSKDWNWIRRKGKKMAARRKGR